MRQLLVTMLAALACAAKPAPPARPAVKPAREGVVLLQPGREPRQLLRLDPRVGAREQVTVHLQVDRRTTRDGVERPQEVNHAAWQAELAIQSIEGDGAIRYEAAIGHFVGPPREGPTAAARGRQLLAAEGRTTRAGWPLGYELEVNEAELAGGARLSSEATPLYWLPNYIATFPEQPVGVGARWRRTTREGPAEPPRLATAELELLSLEDGRGTVAIRWKIDHDEEIRDPRGAAARGRITLEGSGTLTFDTGRLLASAADLSWTGRLALSERGRVTDVVAIRDRVAVRALGNEPLVGTTLGPFDPDPEHRLVFGDPCRRLVEPHDGPFAGREAPGRPRLEGTCRAGLPDGRWRQYHPGGQPELEGTMRAGQPHGQWTQWSPGGDRLGAFTLANGTGRAVLRWPSGTPRIEAELRQGTLHGKFQSWHANGRPFREGAFENDWPSGRWTSRTADGATTRSERFDPACKIATQVVPGSPAAKAGIKPGDLFLRADGTDLRERALSLADVVDRAGARPITFDLQRGAERLQISVGAVRLVAPGARWKIGVQLGCRHPE